MADVMDIDMDLDLGPIEDDAMFEVSALPTTTDDKPVALISAISNPLSDPDALQIVPHKVHLRGLDNLTSSDIRAFASKYFGGASLEKVEWIDDTSANLVYETPALAMEALIAFTDANIGDSSQTTPLQMIPAKSVSLHPETRLYARLALAGDRKQAGARERSRFYLFNPDHDPAERRKGVGYKRRSERRYRDRDEGSHKDHIGGEPFDASLYDDDEISRAVRASKSYESRDSRSSISSTEYHGQGVRKAYANRRNTKELFPERIARHRRDGGRLRDRSASPSRDSEVSDAADSTRLSKSRLRDLEASGVANRLQAQMIKARLKEASIEPKELFPQKSKELFPQKTKELFPQKSTSNHRRSDAVDATDATADLFATRMPVPFLDGSNDIKPRQRDLMSRITKPSSEERRISVDISEQNGFSIRGHAGQQSAGVSIKGTALTPEPQVKELFPHKSKLNAGKELFSEKLEGRGGRRQRAEDMFY